MIDWNYFIDRARAVGQLGVHLLLLLFAGVYVDFLWPGHMDYTDQDMVLVYETALIVGGIWVLFLVNTIVFWRRKHWAKYRKRTRVYLVILPFVLGSLRTLVFGLVFGAEDRVFVQVEEEEFVLAELRLYENGRFYTQAYGTWMVENTGRYEWAEKELVLEYDDAPGPHMDRSYTLEGERLMPKDSTRQVLVEGF
jgi:hypothetical protein